jgi:hypothetical protein
MQGAAVLLVVVLAEAGIPTGQEQTPTRTTHTRAVDGDARRVLDEALLRSPTIRRIVAYLDESDVIAYVQGWPFSERTADLHLMGAVPGFRFVLIRINVRRYPKEAVAWLGHELEHALEIAATPEVLDEFTLRRLYERTGWATDHGFDTAAAREVWTRVLAEVTARKNETPGKQE